MSADPSKSSEVLLQVGDLLVDTYARTVLSNGEVVDLPDLSFRLLLALARHAPNRVGKEELIAEVWEGLEVGDETLTQRVRLLRQAISEDNDRSNYIQTIRNQGYRLAVPVVSPAESARSAASTTEQSAQPAVPSSPASWKSALLVPIAACLVLAVYLGFRDNAPVSSPPSAQGIAVLPFTQLATERDNDYFALGIHEELLNRLSEIEDFAVVPHRSVLPYQASDLSAAELAQALNVEAIVEGSVRLTGDQVRINAQLIDGQTDRYIWSKSFERELSIENLFAIQAELAAAIADSLQVQLSEPQRASLVSLPTEDLEAYNLYLLGRYHTSRYTPSDLAQAVALLRNAVEIDPQFGQAWASLGWAYSFQGTSYGDHPPTEVYPRAREAALRALALDSELADAHSLYGDILSWYDWDWEAAEREYRRSLELDPFNALLSYVLFLGTQLRHDEALVLVQNLLNEFPQDPAVHINAAWRYMLARDFERAISQAQLAGNHADVLAVQGWANLFMGNTGAALDLFSKDVAAKPGDSRAHSNLAVATIRNGDKERGQALLDQLLTKSEGEYVAAELIAVVFFELGELDAGFEWLGRAFAERSRGLIFLLEDPIYDGVREDPRFSRLLVRLGLRM